jgi:DNA (cytosine-5)-methyltransferase 3A
MKVLSLCDGMSCGRLALERCGIPVEEYYASEIKDIAADVLGDGWTIDVIAHILSFIPDGKD